MKRTVQLMLVLLAFFSAAITIAAQQNENAKPSPNPLVRLLQSKGIITEQEAAMVSDASSAAEAEQRLAKLLLSKSIISQAEYDQTISAPGATSTQPESSAPRLVNAA